MKSQADEAKGLSCPIANLWPGHQPHQPLPFGRAIPAGPGLRARCHCQGIRGFCAGTAWGATGLTPYSTLPMRRMNSSNAKVHLFLAYRGFEWPYPAKLQLFSTRKRYRGICSVNRCTLAGWDPLSLHTSKINAVLHFTSVFHPAYPTLKVPSQQCLHFLWLFYLLPSMYRCRFRQFLLETNLSEYLTLDIPVHPCPFVRQYPACLLC